VISPAACPVRVHVHVPETWHQVPADTIHRDVDDGQALGSPNREGGKHQSHGCEDAGDGAHHTLVLSSRRRVHGARVPHELGGQNLRLHPDLPVLMLPSMTVVCSSHPAPGGRSLDPVINYVFGVAVTPWKLVGYLGVLLFAGR